MALDGLAETQDTSVVDAVVTCLRDPVPTVQVHAIDALVELGDPRVRQELEALRTSNTHPDVDRALGEALTRLPR